MAQQTRQLSKTSFFDVQIWEIETLSEEYDALLSRYDRILIMAWMAICINSDGFPEPERLCFSLHAYQNIR